MVKCKSGLKNVSQIKALVMIKENKNVFPVCICANWFLVYFDKALTECIWMYNLPI